MYFIVSMRASSSTAAAPQHGQRQPHQMHFGHGIVEVEHRETHWGARMWGAQTTKEIMGNGTSSKGTSSNVSRQGHCGQRERRHRSKGSGGNRWVGVPHRSLRHRLTAPAPQEESVPYVRTRKVPYLAFLMCTSCAMFAIRVVLLVPWRGVLGP